MGKHLHGRRHLYTFFAPGFNYSQLSDLYSVKTANCALVNSFNLEGNVFICMKMFACEILEAFLADRKFYNSKHTSL